MKRIYTIILCLLSLSSFAQNDSVSLGAGADQMAFYSLSNGQQGTAANNDWHLAFAARQIGGFSFSQTNQATAIRINEAYGLKLFRSTQNMINFSSFDTTGYQSWQQMHNPDTTWTIGAFNINVNLSDIYNFGWGEYNPGDHNIYSDSAIYLIQLPDGTFKKFAIINLVYDTAFNVEFANLDNSANTTMEIRKSPYSTKNFVYLNLENDSLMDKEPALSSWDFMALRYTNTGYDTTNPGKDIGILTNDADNVYFASGPTALQNCYSGSGFYNYINTIGHSWNGQPGDTFIPVYAYFIQAPSGNYKFKVTGFGGAATGVIDFSLGNCGTVQGISQVDAATMDVAIYPVPASDVVNISVSSEADASLTIQLFDMTGRAILAQTAAAHSGENNIQLNTASLQSGNYIITLSSDAGKANKLISIVR